MNELALFAGGGGGILGGILVGWRTVCAVEIDSYCRRILLSRQRDGILPRFPIWDDVRTFDGKLWRGHVDVISGGFPCQDISCAGKGAGIEGERSGLWREFARIIGEVRPRYVFVENSAALVIRGLGRVLGDLAALGYDARWGVLGARDVGAPHRRERSWIVADSQKFGWRERGKRRFDSGGQREPERSFQDVADASSEGFSLSECQAIQRETLYNQGRTIAECSWWGSEPELDRVAHGVAFRVDKLRALGNGQVPICAAMAFKILSGQ